MRPMRKRIKAPRGIVLDWATSLAEVLSAEDMTNISRVSAIITVHAKPILDMLPQAHTVSCATRITEDEICDCGGNQELHYALSYKPEGPK